jgi:acetyl esterase/lipase
MASEALHKLTAYMRGLQGTKAGWVRDGVLRGVGRVFSAAHAADRKWRANPKPHPLFRIIAAQTGDPYERWPLDDLPALRRESEELLEFLPREVKTAVERRVFGEPGIWVLELTPGSIRDDRCVVYFHGGGFVMGSAESVLPEADVLARKLQRRVYVVDYPLAPEHSLVAQTQAATTALRSIYDSHPTFDIVGESAGGYLGLYSLLHESDLNEACQNAVLFYPLLDLSVDSEAVQRFDTGYLLSRRILQWFVDCATGGTEREDWRLERVDAQLHPDILIIVGEFDPLLDDWRAISRCAPRLTTRVAPGLMHGFMQMRGILPERDEWIDETVRFLANH